MDPDLEAISRLRDDLEAGQSSHWRRHLEHESWMSSEPGARTGLGAYIPWNMRRALIHHLLQTPFRRHGRSFASFPAILKAGQHIARVQGRVFDLDDLRQVLTLACVRHHLELSTAAPQTIAVIGDGYGRLASLLLATLPRCLVVLVNLTPALLVDLLSLRRVWPDLKVIRATASDDLVTALATSQLKVVAIRADEVEALEAMRIDGAFNVSSMQEMDPPIIDRYFSLLRRNCAPATWFYCSNASSKTLPDGTVVRFADYPWHANDVILLDELCPWAQTNYLAWPPPWYIKRVHLIRHRLVWLHKAGTDTLLSKQAVNNA